MLTHREIGELISYYYLHWKRTPEYRQYKSFRR